MDSKKFMCTYKDCLKKFNTSSHLKRHEKTHSNQIYRCGECDAIFSSQYNQKRHIDNKHLKKKPKKYQCDYCEEDFNKESWLIRHTYRHTGILPYECTFENCQSRFLLPSRLRRHMKAHEYGYSCPKEDCSEKFAKYTEFTHHLATAHAKVYKCSECDKMFVRSANLKEHSMTHKSVSERHKFLCPKKGCRRSYFRRSNLRHHVRNYHEKRPYTCTFGKCCKCFRTQEQLDRHTLRHTPRHISSKRFKKEVIDDLISIQRLSRRIQQEDLDDSISRQDSSGDVEKDDFDENISRQLTSINELDENISNQVASSNELDENIYNQVASSSELDENISSQDSSSSEFDENISSPSREITNEEDGDISSHNIYGQLKNATVIYLNKDGKC